MNKLKISIFRVKKYNATYNHVICVDGVPTCITESVSRANEIMSYLSGNKNVKIKDGTVKNALDEVLNYKSKESELK